MALSEGPTYTNKPTQKPCAELVRGKVTGKTHSLIASGGDRADGGVKWRPWDRKGGWDGFSANVANNDSRGAEPPQLPPRGDMRAVVLSENSAKGSKVKWVPR